MTFILRSLLGLTGVTGAGVVVGAPIVMKSQAYSVWNFEDSQNGGGSSLENFFLNLEKCQSHLFSNNEEVDFGQKEAEKVCWKIEQVSDSSFEYSWEDKKYNHLFQALWNNKDKTWSQHNDFWRNNCPVGDKWIFVDQVQEKEFLGLCVKSNNPINSWLIVERKDQDKPIIKVCSGECFESTKVSDWRKLDTSLEKNQDKWKIVKFQKVN